MARLYIVGTPIGNRRDLTPRALEIFQSVGAIGCEDTRVTRKLFVDQQIKTPLVSLHHHSLDTAIDTFLDRTADGDLAYVTDAGTPGISDPGGKLVARAHARGIEVVSIPGPSALAAALSISGFPSDQFLFLGFLPHKKGRVTLFSRIAATTETAVIFESPHRLMKTLESLTKLHINKQIAVCREITKMHESVVRGTADIVLNHFQRHPDQVRGEVVIVVGPG